MKSRNHFITTIFKEYLSKADMDHHRFLQSLGIVLNVKTGHLSYIKNFQPLKLNFELVFVRHGETYGNCGQSTAKGKIDLSLVNAMTKNTEKRIFQGDVDTEINQLTDLGRLQAEDAAILLEDELLSHNWVPTIVYYSPLTRAKETGLTFVNRNNFHEIYVACNGIREMSFGTWDNQRVCDMTPTNVCHSFYQNQNSLVRNIDSKTQQPSESFCDVLKRAYTTLLELNEKHQGGKVVMFSHSMFGAACCILLGKGQRIENGNYLAFDGKRSNGEHYTMPHATPFYLNFEKPVLTKLCRA
jgi:broad specificity phosphatase PhoE